MSVLDLMRDQAMTFPLVGEPDRVTAARVWHCKYRSLAGLANLPNLNTLVVASYPDPDLGPLSGLTHLRYLRILHAPEVSDLSPLENLHELRTLRLETLPSWDSASRRLIVRSLAPLASLPRLAHVELFGVVPQDGSLSPLERAPALETVRVGKYSDQECERFYRATGITNDFAPAPGIADWG